MSRKLLSQIRHRRHSAAVVAGVVMVMVAVLTSTFARLCTHPMPQHHAETTAACSLDEKTMNQHGSPTLPDADDCSFKVCLDAQADTSFAPADFPKINKLTLWAVVLPTVIALLFQRSSLTARSPQLGRRQPCSIPLFYQFCSLLN